MSSPAPWLSETHALRCELAGGGLRTAGGLRLRATGWSMLPAIWTSDVLVMHPACASAVSKGEIAVFSTGRQFVAHRVLAKTGDRDSSTIQTQGDALPRPDSPLPCRYLLGKVSFILRNGHCIEPP